MWKDIRSGERNEWVSKGKHTLLTWVNGSSKGRRSSLFYQNNPRSLFQAGGGCGFTRALPDPPSWGWDGNCWLRLTSLSSRTTGQAVWVSSCFWRLALNEYVTFPYPSAVGQKSHISAQWSGSMAPSVFCEVWLHGTLLYIRNVLSAMITQVEASQS